MRAALVGVDVVGEALDRLVIAVVVLERHFENQRRRRVFLLEVDDRMDDVLAVVQIADVLDEPIVKLELIALPGALVFNDDLKALVQIRKLAQSLGEHFVLELDIREDLAVRLEGDLGAGLRARADHFQIAGLLATLEFHVMHFAIAADFNFQPFRKRVDDRCAHAMKPAADLVRAPGRMLEFAARAELGENHLDGRNALLGMDADGDAAPVIDDAA